MRRSKLTASAVWIATSMCTLFAAAPEGADKTLDTFANTPRTIISTDFGYSDADGDLLDHIRIDTLSNGSLHHSQNGELTSGSILSAGDLAADRLYFTPDDDITGNNAANFTFSVNDGSSYDPAPNTISFNVADTFTADGDYYISQSNTVYHLDTGELPFKFTAINPSDKVRMNAIGFNYKDGYIYGMKSSTNQLLKISASGSVTNLGAIPGVPVKNYYIGGFDLDGNFYIALGNKMYIVDVDSENNNANISSTKINLSSRFTAPDLAYSVHDNNLYGCNNSKLYKIDMTPGPNQYKVTSKTVVNLPQNTYGAAFFDGGGRLYISANQTGDIFRIDDLETPVAVFASTGQPTSSNDGTSTSGSPVIMHTISDPSADTATFGDVVTFTYTIDNGLTSGIAYGNPLHTGLEDTLNQADLTFTTGTLVIKDQGGSTLVEGIDYIVNSYGSTQTLDIDNLQISPLGQLTVTIDVTIAPGIASGLYYNQAVITGINSYHGGDVFEQILSDNPGGKKPDPTPYVIPGQSFNNSISGTVFNDLNKNGTQDNGEQGIANTLITLNNSQTQRTNADGDYSFTGLGDGTYTITETDTLPFQSITANTISGIVLSSGTSATINFADYGKSNLKGSVFSDLDNDQIYDNSESGLSGVTLKLRELTGELITTVTTNNSGNYEFKNIEMGAYWIEEIDPAGYASVSNNRHVVNVTHAGDFFHNFADTLIKRVSGHVFDDINGNGIMDKNEQGISGVTVNLDGNTGTNGQTAVTDSIGFYSFITTTGEHTVSEIEPGGYISTSANMVRVIISDNGLAEVDFANQKIGHITGYVYDDVNDNGKMDYNENGHAGITVHIPGGSSVVTDADGAYDVTRPTGSYTISLSGLPANTLIVGSDTKDVTLNSGNSAHANFGLVSKGVIAGNVFHDINHNGTFDLHEDGVEGVYVALPDGTYTTTASDGSYSFTNRSNGTYAVSVINLGEFFSTTPEIVSVTVADDYSANIDFGLVATGIVSGTTFNDVNGNGVQDTGEMGIAGVKIDIDTAPAEDLYTDADGRYIFIGIPNGSYIVTETNPPGAIDITPNTINEIVQSGESPTADYADQFLQAVPVAVSDNYSLQKGKTVNITLGSGVLSNDSDPNGDKLYAELVSDVSSGTLTLNSDGSFSYTHNNSSTSSDQFTYRVKDDYGDGNIVAVSFTISPLTPAIGLTVVQKDAQLQWSAEEEVNVKAYIVIDAATGRVIEKVMADGSAIYSVKLEQNRKVTLQVVDRSGFTQTHTPINGNLKTTIYKLSKGWNMLTLTTQNVINLPELTNSTTGIIWSWNGTRYVQTKRPKATEGFWVYAPKAQIIHLTGAVTDKVPALQPGWNLVGPVENSYIPADADEVFTWHQTYDKVTGNDKVLLEGIAYWIFSTK